MTPVAQVAVLPNQQKRTTAKRDFVTHADLVRRGPVVGWFVSRVFIPRNDGEAPFVMFRPYGYSGPALRLYLTSEVMRAVVEAAAPGGPYRLTAEGEGQDATFRLESLPNVGFQPEDIPGAWPLSVEDKLFLSLICATRAIERAERFLGRPLTEHERAGGASIFIQHNRANTPIMSPEEAAKILQTERELATQEKNNPPSEPSPSE